MGTVSPVRKRGCASCLTLGQAAIDSMLEGLAKGLAVEDVAVSLVGSVGLAICANGDVGLRVVGLGSESSSFDI